MPRVSLRKRRLDALAKMRDDALEDNITRSDVQLNIPAIFVDDFLFSPYRYKCAHGGRGSAKSWSFAQALVARAHSEKLLILCTREFQNSIGDSVIRLLEVQIDALNLRPYFDVQKTVIYSKVTGSEFIFKGLHRNVQEIKSTEGVDICWVEEAQSVSEESWQILIPTIRKPRSEIWVTWNPLNENDPTQKRFVENKPPNGKVIKVNWNHNPFFPQELELERKYLLAVDPDAYDHVWEGECLKISSATIFRGRYTIKPFETPKLLDRVFLGADFGFADDPSTLVGGFIDEEKNILYIDREAYGVRTEIDHLPDLYGTVEGAHYWTIKGDPSRPETISYLSRRGFNIIPAEKWPNSVEDGIAHLKGFAQIIIHPDKCPHTAQEFRLYSYKTDRKTEEILPVPIDKHNHCIDALRYALDTYIKGRGGVGIWHKLIEEELQTPWLHTNNVLPNY